MSTTERREVHSTRIVKTLSPQRATSNQNITDFDNNLDNLLEDLQSSVSRPGSSLGNTYKETRTTTTYGSGGRSDSLGRVQHLTAANPTTIVSDDTYNYKPGETVRTVKTYKENYASYNLNTDASPEKLRMQNNINKLDTLLDDLQQVRQGTLERNTNERITMDQGLPEHTSASQQVVSKRSVHRELVYDSDSAQRSAREGSVGRDVQYINDSTLRDVRSIRQQSPTRSTQKSTKVQSYDYSTDVENVIVPATEIVETTQPEINSNILAQLDPNLLPPPNTKVTTTIKTYTYEIPSSGYPSTVSPKLSETVYSSNPSTPSQSFAYNKVENNTSTLNYPSDYIRPVSPGVPGFRKEYSQTTSVTNEGYGKPKPSPTPSGKEVYVYNESTTRNITRPGPDHRSHAGGPRSPPGQVHIYNETTSNVNQQPPTNRYPDRDPRGTVPGPTSQTTYIINETHNTRNVTAPYPRNDYPPNREPGPTTVVYRRDTRNTSNYLGPNEPYTDPYKPKHPQTPTDVKPYDGEPRTPRDPNVNITYKYTTHHTSTNNYRGQPVNDESEPLLHPLPFPTEPNEHIDGPPKKLDELMAEIGKEPPNNAYNAGYNARQAEQQLQRKENTQVSAETQKRDYKDMPKTKNVAGPPVYYPPGHEMFSHKEESGGYSAQGGMMKESGKYKYEAKSSSKSKSSSGVAVVPVCLPLCCGLPCVIM